MGVFEFILGIVLISTLGKVIAARQSRPTLPQAADRPEIAQLNDAVSELNERLGKLEEERDFYRALMESPDRKSFPPPPSDGPGSPSA